MLLIQSYENAHYASPDAEPIDFLLYVMESRGLTRKDLEPFIGTRCGNIQSRAVAFTGYDSPLVDGFRAPRRRFDSTLRRYTGGVALACRRTAWRALPILALQASLFEKSS